MISLKRKDKLKTIKYYVQREKKRKRIILFFINVLLASIIVVISFAIIRKYNLQRELQQSMDKERQVIEEQQATLKKIKESYNEYVETVREATIYKFVDDNYEIAGTLSSGTKISLKEKEIISYKDIYFELENINYYVKYTDVKIVDSVEVEDHYRNYIPFNENVVSNNPAILKSDNGEQYTIKEELSLPIIIKDNKRYYVEYDNKLLYLESDKIVRIDKSENSNVKTASKIAVIAYHYTYSSDAGDKCLSPTICHEINQISKQFNYLNENKFYTTTLRDLELFLERKIQLPEKSVTITVDDGWWFDRMYLLANEYKVNVTLFFIGILQNNANILSYSTSSKYVQFASHTYNLHNTGICPGGQGSPLKCSSKETIMSDLKKSREQLKNTTYFAWPFYEYNDYAIELVKEAGFTMAFTGGMYKSYPGVNMYTVPRYTIHNNTKLEEFSEYVN